MMLEKAWVAGVSMIKLAQPGQSQPYDVMAAQAVREASADAGIGYDRVQLVYAGYVYGDSTSGQKGGAEKKFVQNGDNTYAASMSPTLRADCCPRGIL